MRTSALFPLVALLALWFSVLPARAQITITSSSRVAALATAAGNSNFADNAPGVLSRTLTVSGDPSSAVIDSDFSSSVLRYSFVWSSQSNPGGALPGAVAQVQVQFVVTAATQLNVTRTNTGASTASSALTIVDQFGGTVLSPGQPDGSIPIGPGPHTLTYLVTCPVFASGSNAFSITFGAPTPPPPPPPPLFAFTYQGRLSSAGPLPPAIDIEYDFYPVVTGGPPTPDLGGGTVPNVPVSGDGLFEVRLDPAAPFGPETTYLELRIRPAGFGAYQTLSPRTALTMAPKATYAAASTFADEAGLARALTSRDRIRVGGDAFNPAATPGIVFNSPGNTNLEVGFVGMRDANHLGFKGPSGLFGLIMDTASARVGLGPAYADPGAVPEFDVHVRGVTDTQIAITGAPNGRTWSLQSSAGNYGPGSQLNGSFQIVDRTSNTAALLIDQFGQTGIGTTAPQQRLDVAGNIRADALVYSTPVTSYVSIGDAAWRPRNGNTTIVNVAVGNGGLVLSTGDLAGAVAELQLPNNARITSIVCAYTDNDPSQNIRFSLAVNDFTNFTNFVDLGTSSGAAVGGRLFTSTAAAGFAVNNGLRYYQIIATPVGSPFGQWTPNLAIRGVSVAYTLETPGH